MRPLILSPDVLAAITKLREYAEANPVSWAEVQARATGALPGAVGDDPNLQLEIPMGYRCVFSIEFQRMFKTRHLSVSVDTPGKLPNEFAVDELAKAFGFPVGIFKGTCKVYVEKDEQSAVNVIEII